MYSDPVNHSHDKMAILLRHLGIDNQTIMMIIVDDVDEIVI